MDLSIPGFVTWLNDWFPFKTELGTVATSNDYNDLDNKPYIADGTVDRDLSSTSTNPVQNRVINSALETKLGKTSIDSLDSSGNQYVIANLWEIYEIGDQRALNSLNIGDEVISLGYFDGVLTYENTSFRNIRLELKLTNGTNEDVMVSNYESGQGGSMLQLNVTSAVTLAPNQRIFLFNYNENVNNNPQVSYTVRVAINQISSIANILYPVGSIYMSINSTNPAVLFGGKWTQLQNQFLLAAGSSYEAGSTGGEATHTLTTNEMPSHTHTQNSHNHTQNAHSHDTRHSDSAYVVKENSTGASNKRITAASSGSTYVDTSSGAKFHNYNATQSVTATNKSATATNQNTGGGKAHNNMPPYLAVFMWKRIL